MCGFGAQSYGVRRRPGTATLIGPPASGRLRYGSSGCSVASPGPRRQVVAGPETGTSRRGAARRPASPFAAAAAAAAAVQLRGAAPAVPAAGPQPGRRLLRRHRGRDQPALHRVAAAGPAAAPRSRRPRRPRRRRAGRASGPGRSCSGRSPRPRVSTASRATKDRSIFSSLTGSRRRWTSEEYPVPKSSRDIFTPCPVSPARVSAARCGSSSRTCSVISSWSDPAGTPCRASRAATRAREAGGVDVARGDVDRDRHEQALRPPPGDLGQRRLQDVLGEVRHQPGGLGDGDELVRGDPAALRVHPAHQRLQAGHLAVEADLGLVVQLHLAGVQRPAQVAEEAEPVGGVAVPLGLVHLDARTVPLRLVHRDVRAAQQPLGVQRVVGVDGDPGAGLQHEGEAVQVERRGRARRPGGGRPAGRWWWSPPAAAVRRTRRRRAGRPRRRAAGRAAAVRRSAAAAGRRRGGRGCR